MTPPSSIAGEKTTCWKSIGTWGDRTCPELATHVHCRNCPVYADGAVQLLDVEVSPEYLRDHARQFALPKRDARVGRNSAVAFRIAGEWLALPTSVFSEVAPLRRIHSLPHRRDGVVTGVANIRGELIVCVSLAAALAIGTAPPEAAARLAVMNRDGSRFVFPADEVAGLVRFDDAELTAVPATLAHARATFTRGMLAWSDRSLAMLDDQRLFQSLDHHLA
jgi:chemotaxis-related protein WspD